MSRPSDLFRPSSDNERLEQRVSGMLKEFLQEESVTSALPDRDLEALFASSVVPERATPVLDYFAELVDTYIPHASHVASPRSFAHMTSSVPFFMRELGALLIGMNQNLVKQDASRSLTCLERQTLAMMHRLTYGESDAFYQAHTHAVESSLGIVSSGSTLANILALWCARNARQPADEDAPAPRFVVLGSRLMHYSFGKAADLLGLGKRGLVPVPVDARQRIDIDALRDALARCRAAGRTVLAIVGVAGTTDAGSIDPLDALADIAAEEGAHFHVDGAWGGPLLFSERHRAKLAGVARADSVTIDGHKQLHLPMGMGMLLFKDPALAKVIEKEAPYLIRAGSSDLGRRALEGSRAGSVLYLHAALHILGRQGYSALVDEGIALAETCAGLIAREPAFELLADPVMRVIVYRYLPAALRGRGALSAADNALIDDVNRRLYDAQKADGHGLVSMTTLPVAPHGDVACLRAVIANPTTSLDDFREVLAHQLAIGREIDAVV